MRVGDNRDHMRGVGIIMLPERLVKYKHEALSIDGHSFALSFFLSFFCFGIRIYKVIYEVGVFVYKVPLLLVWIVRCEMMLERLLM